MVQRFALNAKYDFPGPKRAGNKKEQKRGRYEKMKKWMAFLMAATMAASMAGCASGDNTAPSAGSSAEPGQTETGVSGGEKKKISMAVWNGNWAEDLEKFEQDFNSKNPDIELDVQMQTGDYADFLGAKVAADDLPDIYILTPYKQVQAFAEAGRIMDLSEESFVDRVYPDALEAGKGADGKIYAYPANYEYLGVFYNKALFEEAGIDVLPTTREEFEAACVKLEGAGIQPIAATYKDSWTLKHLFSALLTPIVQDDIPGFIAGLDSGEGTFDVEGVDEVFQFADIMKQYSGSNMMDQDSTSGFNALANGQAAMLISGEFSQATVAAMDPVPEIGCFAIPVSSDPEKNKLSVDVGICYAVNAKTEYPEECKRILDYMSDPEEEGGYMQIVASELGDAPPAMPFDKGAASPAMDDYTAYCNDGNTVPWVYQQYANGFDVTSGDIFQGYMAGAKDQETVIKELDESYLNFIE